MLVLSVEVIAVGTMGIFLSKCYLENLTGLTVKRRNTFLDGFNTAGTVN